MDAIKLEVKVHEGEACETHQLLLTPEGHSPTGGSVHAAGNGHAVAVDWQLIAPGSYSLLIHGESYDARIFPAPGQPPGNWLVAVRGTTFRVELVDPRVRRRSAAGSDDEGPQEVHAPMPGRIVKVLVEADQQVAAGEGLLVMEAMKMQNEIKAHRAGKVEKIYVVEGVGVETGARLIRLI